MSEVPSRAATLFVRLHRPLAIVLQLGLGLVAFVVLFGLPETKPQSHPHARPESLKQTFAGYGRVFKDVPFLAFISVSAMMWLVYMNMNSTLGYYLREQHGQPEVNYGALLSINAIMVVLLQFWVTRRIEKYKPMLIMATGSQLYALGFAMYGFVSTFALFITAMVIITIGEMVVSPIQQSMVATFAPEAMRGRYMAVSGLSWSISFTVGPYFAGLILDGGNPSLLLAFRGFVGILATLGFIVLNRSRESRAGAVEPAAAD